MFKMSTKLLVGAVIFYFWFVCFTDGKKLPSIVTPCKRTNPEFSECYANAIRNLKPYFDKGIPELGVPPCNPLIIPRIEMQQPDNANVGFNAVLTNCTFWGGLDYKVNNMKVNLDKGTFQLDLTFPHLKMQSKYKAIGKVLIIQFEGDGDAHGEFGDVTVHADWLAKKVIKNGKEHFKVIEDSSKLDVKSLKIQFDNLFKNNQALTDNTNRLINENIELLTSEVKPIVEKTLITLVTSVVNYVNDNYSIDELYPA